MPVPRGLSWQCNYHNFHYSSSSAPPPTTKPNSRIVWKLNKSFRSEVCNYVRTAAVSTSTSSLSQFNRQFEVGAITIKLEPPRAFSFMTWKLEGTFTIQHKNCRIILFPYENFKRPNNGNFPVVSCSSGVLPSLLKFPSIKCFPQKEFSLCSLSFQSCLFPKSEAAEAQRKRGKNNVCCLFVRFKASARFELLAIMHKSSPLLRDHRHHATLAAGLFMALANEAIELQIFTDDENRMCRDKTLNFPLHFQTLVFGMSFTISRRHRPSEIPKKTVLYCVSFELEKCFGIGIENLSNLLQRYSNDSGFINRDRHGNIRTSIRNKCSSGSALLPDTPNGSHGSTRRHLEVAR